MPSVATSAGVGPQRLRPGDHVAFFHSSEEAHERVVGEFLRQGVRRGKRVVYLGCERPRERIESYLEGEPRQDGQFQYLSLREGYLRGGRFDAGAMLTALERLIEEGMRSGARGLRVTGETGWLFEMPGWHEAFLDYEERVGGVLEGSPAIGLCQYDVSRCPESFLLRVLDAHPLLCRDGEWIENLLYTPDAGVSHGERFERRLRALRFLQTRPAAAHLKRPAAERSAGGDGSVAMLSAREGEVYHWLGRGYRAAEISRLLFISPKTAEAHFDRIKKKLGIATMGELRRHAIRHGRKD